MKKSTEDDSKMLKQSNNESIVEERKEKMENSIVNDLKRLKATRLKHANSEATITDDEVKKYVKMEKIAVVNDPGEKPDEPIHRIKKTFYKERYYRFHSGFNLDRSNLLIFYQRDLSSYCQFECEYNFTDGSIRKSFYSKEEGIISADSLKKAVEEDFERDNEGDERKIKKALLCLFICIGVFILSIVPLILSLILNWHLGWIIGLSALVLAVIFFSFFSFKINNVFFALNVLTYGVKQKKKLVEEIKNGVHDKVFQTIPNEYAEAEKKFLSTFNQFKEEYKNWEIQSEKYKEFCAKQKENQKQYEIDFEKMKPILLQRKKDQIEEDYLNELNSIKTKYPESRYYCLDDIIDILETGKATTLKDAFIMYDNYQLEKEKIQAIRDQTIAFENAEIERAEQIEREKEVELTKQCRGCYHNGSGDYRCPFDQEPPCAPCPGFTSNKGVQW